MANTRHWTGESDGAFIHKLGFDFITQIEKKMAESKMNQAALARTLGVSEGAVSKMLNNPQNLTLKTIAKYSKALGIKASIVAYDDGDPQNENGLVSSEVFSACWQHAGKPRDFWSLQEITSKRASNTNVCVIYGINVPYLPIQQPRDVVYQQPGHLTDNSAAFPWPLNQAALHHPSTAGGRTHG